MTVVKCRYYFFRSPREVGLIAFSPGSNEYDRIVASRRILLEAVSFEFDLLGEPRLVPIPKHPETIGITIIISPCVEYLQAQSALVEAGFLEWPEDELPVPLV